MILKTERLILRPYREADIKDLFNYAKDERVGPIAGWPPHTNIEESTEIFRKIFAQEVVFVVALRENDIAIGLIGLICGANSNFPICKEEAEISYWIGVPFWGKGLITEAIHEITRYGFEDLRLINIWSGYFDGNERSKRAQEKCGYRYHHTEENNFYPLINDVRTEHINRLTKEEWTAFTASK